VEFSSEDSLWLFGRHRIEGHDAVREVLDPWLGKPQWKQTEGRDSPPGAYSAASIAASPRSISSMLL
jgi:hypothetical protein